jgi:hypothetical protein
MKLTIISINDLHPSALESSQAAKSSMHLLVKQNDKFPLHCQSLKDHSVYSFTKQPWKCEVGSITDFAQWKIRLSNLTRLVSKKGEFKELIEFTVLDGVIDNGMCLKLYADFKNLRRYMQLASNHDDEFLSIYDNLKRAFYIAAWEGAVVLKSSVEESSTVNTSLED